MNQILEQYRNRLIQKRYSKNTISIYCSYFVDFYNYFKNTKDQKNQKMIYTIERANLITERLRKFADSYAYMVVGQFANIDFWINETVNSIRAIDEHNVRFEKMCEAQKRWIEEKNVRVPDNCHICNGICELSEQHYKKPELPKQKAKSEKKEARKELVDSAYYFLIRCYKIDLLNEEELKNYCNQIGTSIDLNDLKK